MPGQPIVATEPLSPQQLLDISPTEPLTQGLGSPRLGDPSVTFDTNIIQGLQSDRFVTTKALQIAVGPPTYDLAADVDGPSEGVGNLRLLGLVQDFNLDQNRQIAEIFEIGSRDLYYLTNRTTRQISLSRIMFYGPTLLRALYEGSGVTFPDVAPEYTPGLAYDSLMFINLDSIFFEQPMGLFIQAGTVGQRSTKRINPLGAAYLEECLVRAHNVRGSANQGFVAENVVMTFKHNVPVEPFAE